MIDVKSLRALLAEATPGPWAATQLESGARFLTDSDELLIADVTRARDLDLIAAMHATLPALLDRLEKLEVENSELTEKYSNVILGIQELLEYVDKLEAVADEAARLDNRREENGEKPTYLTRALAALDEVAK